MFFVAVYIPPDANSKDALQELNEVITVAVNNRMVCFIVAGDFNQILPTYSQLIKRVKSSEKKKKSKSGQMKL